MTDERLNLPSASSLHIDFACPGRRTMLANLPNVIEPDDDEAQRGTRIHRAFELGDPSELDEEDREIYEAGLRSEKQVIADWCENFNITDCEEMERECRIFLHDDQLRPACSGKLDKHFISREQKRVLILELKSLWCSNLPPSEKAWQGRLQVCLCAEEYDATHVRFVFNKALLRQTDVCDYEATHIAQARNAIFFALWNVEQPHAPRIAGAHCRYCMGKASCPEAGAYSLLPSVIAHNALASGDHGDPVAAVQCLAPVDLVKIWSASLVINKICEAVKARLKAMPAEQLAELGLQLGKGRTTRKVNNARAVINVLKAMNLSEEKIDNILKLSTTDIAALLRLEVGMSAKGAPQWVKESLADFLDETVSEPPLEHIAG